MDLPTAGTRRGSFSSQIHYCSVFTYDAYTVCQLRVKVGIEEETLDVLDAWAWDEKMMVDVRAPGRSRGMLHDVCAGRDAHAVARMCGAGSMFWTQVLRVGGQSVGPSPFSAVQRLGHAPDHCDR